MKSLYIFAFSFLWFAELGLAQNIIVNSSSAPESSLTAEELTREVLINGGVCSDISNFVLKDNPLAQFPNANRSWGYFQRGTSDFPFESGIILTSGRATDAIGPNGPTSSYGDATWTGEPMLNVISGYQTRNATVFEFDFIPYGNEIRFNYIFASNEYEDDSGLGFECSGFNDVFAFVISGPGITNDPGINGKNIALLPNGLPVTIDNVNGVPWCGDPTYFTHINDWAPPINYNGMTHPLTAYSEVIPGETYHIRLMIADAVDNSYDSAVFLEAGSFNLGGAIVNLEGIELGESEYLCDLTEYTMIVDLEVPTASYQWYFNNNPIPGATNATYTATETGLYAVEILANGCQAMPQVELFFENSPDLTEPEEKFECSATGIYIFDLTSFYPELTPDFANYNIVFYNTLAGAENEIDLDQILNPTNFEVNVTDGEVTIYARATTEHGCYSIVPLKFQVGVGAETAPLTYQVCDEDGDSVSEFNLLDIGPSLVTSNPDDLIYEFYLDAGLTQPIANATNFVNSTNPQIIYVNIYNPDLGEQACPVVEELTLEVLEFPETQSQSFTLCDNLNDSSEFIDLTQNEIVLSSGINAVLSYHLTEGGPAIPNPTHFEMTTSPLLVHVLVRNQNGTCERLETLTYEFEEAPEAIDDMVEAVECSLSEYAVFNLPSYNENFVADVSGLTFTYHLTQNEAMQGTNPLPANYTNTVPNQILFVRVENENGCYDIGQIQLSTMMIHNQLESALTVCDDPYVENDGIAIFDLTQRNADIENSLGNTGYQISFYTSLNDAVAGTNPIVNPTAFQNTQNPQMIYARAETNTGICGGIVDFQIEVLEVPEFDLDDTIYFCTSDALKTYQFFGNFATYNWLDPSGNVVSNTNTVQFTEEGIYTLEVTSDVNSCPARREIEVIFDTAPIITNIVVDGNTVTISATGGIPPYQYSYNNGLTWSNHYVFEDVPGGIYDLIVKSKYGCISAAKSFGVLGAPNFISPNGDGKNDYWEVRGLEAYPDAWIQIFDRYGKLFVDRQLTPGFKWDGKYMGRPIPSGDYWYIITLGDGKKISGHISVRNRN